MSNLPNPKPINRGPVLVAPVRNESLLARAYLKFEAEGLLDIIWHEGRWSLREFLEWALAPNMVMLGAYNTEASLNQDLGLIGLGWVNSVVRYAGFSKAEVGFGFFRRPSPFRKLAGVRLMLDSFFETYEVDYLFGMTPDQNPLAVRFARKAGFDAVATLPCYTAWEGSPANAVVLMLSRFAWESRRR